MMISSKVIDSIVEDFHHSELDQVEAQDQPEYTTSLVGALKDESKMGNLIETISVQFRLDVKACREAITQAFWTVSI